VAADRPKTNPCGLILSVLMRKIGVFAECLRDCCQ